MNPQKSKLVFLEPAKEDILNIAAYHLEKVGPFLRRIVNGSLDYPKLLK